MSHCLDCNTNLENIRKKFCDDCVHYHAVASAHNKRARRRGCQGTFTGKEWGDLCRRHQNRCVSCGKQGRLTPDHIVPLVYGGTNDIGNIQPLCVSCNVGEKGNDITDYRLSTPEEMAARAQSIQNRVEGLRKSQQPFAHHWIDEHGRKIIVEARKHYFRVHINNNPAIQIFSLEQVVQTLETMTDEQKETLSLLQTRYQVKHGNKRRKHR